MSSACVCLNVLLSSEGVIKILESNVPHQIMGDRRIGIISRETLIYYIIDVLREPGFASFKSALVAALSEPDRDDLEKYSKKALALPVEYISMVPDLMETLIAFNSKFIARLYFLLDYSAITIGAFAKDSCISFIEVHLAQLIRKANSLDTHAATSEHELSPENIYAHLWGDHVYGHETQEELELINQRIRLNQTLRSGISNKRGITFRFKNEVKSLDLANTDRVLAEAKIRSGDNDVRLFGALNTLLTSTTLRRSDFERLTM